MRGLLRSGALNGYKYGGIMEILTTISGTPVDLDYNMEFSNLASEILETARANVIYQSPELKEEKSCSLLSTVKEWIGGLAPPLLYEYPDGIGLSSLKGSWP